MALGTYDEPWEPEEAEFPDDDWTDELPPNPEVEATLTSDSADHRERFEVDQGFSLINSVQHFESFDEGYIFSAVHAMSYTFSGSLCRVGSLCGGRRQRLCVPGHWSIQVSWRLHDGAICD